MKNLLILTLFLVANNLWSQGCIPSAVVLTTQAQVDAFPSDFPGCTIIEGSLGVSGTVQNLDSLIQIEQVLGNVLFNNSTTLTDIDGTSNINHIGGFFTIQTVNNLMDFNGFDALTYVGGDMTFASINFEDVNTLSNLDSIVGSLFFKSLNTTFTDIDGLNNISFIGSNVTVDNRVEFSDLLSNLSYVNGNLTIASIANNSDLLISGIDSVAGDMILDGNGTSSYNLTITDLQKIGGSLEIEQCRPSILEFSNLESVGDELVMYANFQLQEAIFPMLTDIGNDLEIRSNSQLLNVQFPQLETIAQSMSIESNSKLIQLNYDSLKTIGTDLLIYNCIKLVTVNTFNNLLDVNDITLQNNSILDTLIAFNKLVSGVGDVNLQSMRMSHFDSFEKLEAINLFRINQCSLVDSVMLENLTAVTDRIVLINSTSIVDLQVPKLISCNIFIIQNNAAFQSFNSAPLLQTVGVLEFENNQFLTVINGFESLTSVNNLQFKNNGFLADISAFDQAIDINSLTITDNIFLNLCAVQAICDHLSQNSFVANISNNSPSCNSVDQILANCPNPPDTDGDGVPDYIDNCDDTSNPDQADSDNNGIGDACEPFVDSDGDGLANSEDNCPNDYNPDQADANNNGIGDVCDVASDTDGDGIPDFEDNCVMVSNPNQEDSNGNGIGDACDTESDTDGDGVSDSEDNCPNTSNPDQMDTDNNGVGDACEPPIDDDNDGIDDAIDNCLDLYNPSQIDLNNNGIGDVCETFYKVGVGTDQPAAELHLSNGSLYIDNPAKGIIFKDEEGVCYLVRFRKVNGIPKFTSSIIQCPQP